MSWVPQNGWNFSMTNKIQFCNMLLIFMMSHWGLWVPRKTLGVFEMTKTKAAMTYVWPRAGIGYPKFGYPRVIPEPKSKFGYGLGWVCVQIPWVFLGWVPIKFKILGFFGYYPWVPKSIGYPKLRHLRVIPELYYDKKCSYK